VNLGETVVIVEQLENPQMRGEELHKVKLPTPPEDE